MALGPNPNRVQDRDPETRGGEMGNLGSTRFNLPSWATVLIIAVVAVAALLLMRGR